MLAMLKNKNLAIIFILTAISALLHFYNLNWGAPYYFHPDERNIASAVIQLQFPQQMNPHFFAYGSLPIYVIYFTGMLINYLAQILTHHFYILNPSFDQAIQISRIYSALFATLLIPLLFLIGKKLKNETAGILAAFLATTSVGLIQFAHFGTFEMWLTFFSVLLFWTCIQPLTKKTLVVMGILFGILVATKVSSLVLLPIPLLVIILQHLPTKHTNKKIKLHTILQTFANVVLFLIAGFLLYYLSNPFVFLDTPSFQNSMQYESTLALGTLPVFYTGEFFNTIPVLFQFTDIYPFLLNPLLTILFIPSFVYLVYKSFKTKNKLYLLLTTFYVILFFSQAFLFAKWTRYMVPTLPFIYLAIAIASAEFFRSKYQQLKSATIVTIIVISAIFSISYFITAFAHPDTRIVAYQYAQKNISPHAQVLSEVYDLGIIPFNQAYQQISLFDFYELDNNSKEVTNATLEKSLAQNDYIILPSPRLLKTRLEHQNKFPQANAFYQALTNEHLGYLKIYETPCDLFCNIAYLGNPVYHFEQTANVFDRPTVFIFKKMER